MPDDLLVLPFHSIDNADLINTLSESTLHNFPLHIIKELVYNHPKPSNRHASDDSPSYQMFRDQYVITILVMTSV